MPLEDVFKNESPEIEEASKSEEKNLREELKSPKKDKITPGESPVDNIEDMDKAQRIAKKILNEGASALSEEELSFYLKHEGEIDNEMLKQLNGEEGSESVKESKRRLAEEEMKLQEARERAKRKEKEDEAKRKELEEELKKAEQERQNAEEELEKARKQREQTKEETKEELSNKSGQSNMSEQNQEGTTEESTTPDEVSGDSPEENGDNQGGEFKETQQEKKTHIEEEAKSDNLWQQTKEKAQEYWEDITAPEQEASPESTADQIEAYLSAREEIEVYHQIFNREQRGQMELTLQGDDYTWKHKGFHPKEKVVVLSRANSEGDEVVRHADLEDVVEANPSLMDNIEGAPGFIERISQMPEEERERVAWGYRNFGYKAESIKDNVFANTAAMVADGVGKDNKVGDFFARVSDHYESKAENEIRKMKSVEQAREESFEDQDAWGKANLALERVKEYASSPTKLAINGMKAGRWAFGSTWGAVGLYGAMGASTGLGLAKEQRLEKLQEEGQVSDEEIAEMGGMEAFRESEEYEQAMLDAYGAKYIEEDSDLDGDMISEGLIEKAEKRAAEDTITREDIQNAYEQQLPEELLDRLENIIDGDIEDESFTSRISKAGTKVANGELTEALAEAARGHILSKAKKWAKEIEEIDNNPDLSREKKEEKKQAVIDKLSRSEALRDFAKMLDDSGKIDTAAYALRSSQKASKAAVGFMIVEGYLELGYGYLFGEDSSEAVESVSETAEDERVEQPSSVEADANDMSQEEGSSEVEASSTTDTSEIEKTALLGGELKELYEHHPEFFEETEDEWGQNSDGTLSREGYEGRYVVDNGGLYYSGGENMGPRVRGAGMDNWADITAEELPEEIKEFAPTDDVAEVERPDLLGEELKELKESHEEFFEETEEEWRQQENGTLTREGYEGKYDVHDGNLYYSGSEDVSPKVRRAGEEDWVEISYEDLPKSLQDKPEIDEVQSEPAPEAQTAEADATEVDDRLGSITDRVEPKEDESALAPDEDEQSSKLADEDAQESEAATQETAEADSAETEVSQEDTTATEVAEQGLLGNQMADLQEHLPEQAEKYDWSVSEEGFLVRSDAEDVIYVVNKKGELVGLGDDGHVTVADEGSVLSTNESYLEKSVPEGVAEKMKNTDINKVFSQTFGESPGEAEAATDQGGVAVDTSESEGSEAPADTADAEPGLSDPAKNVQQGRDLDIGDEQPATQKGGGASGSQQTPTSSDTSAAGTEQQPSAQSDTTEAAAGIQEAPADSAQTESQQPEASSASEGIGSGSEHVADIQEEQLATSKGGGAETASADSTTAEGQQQSTIESELESPQTETPQGESDAAPGETAAESAEAAGEIIAQQVVPQDEGISHAIDDLQASADIPDEVIEDAWQSSTVETTDGREIPISHAHYVQEGVSVELVQTPEGPRFELDAPQGAKVGSAKDLYEVYQSNGLEAPEWLEESLAEEKVNPDVYGQIDAAAQEGVGSTQQAPAEPGQVSSTEQASQLSSVDAQEDAARAADEAQTTGTAPTEAAAEADGSQQGGARESAPGSMPAAEEYTSLTKESVAGIPTVNNDESAEFADAVMELVTAPENDDSRAVFQSEEDLFGVVPMDGEDPPAAARRMMNEFMENHGISATGEGVPGINEYGVVEEDGQEWLVMNTPKDELQGSSDAFTAEVEPIQPEAEGSGAIDAGSLELEEQSGISGESVDMFERLHEVHDELELSKWNLDNEGLLKREGDPGRYIVDEKGNLVYSGDEGKPAQMLAQNAKEWQELPQEAVPDELNEYIPGAEESVSASGYRDMLEGSRPSAFARKLSNENLQEYKQFNSFLEETLSFMQNNPDSLPQTITQEEFQQILSTTQSGESPLSMVQQSQNETLLRLLDASTAEYTDHLQAQGKTLESTQVNQELLNLFNESVDEVLDNESGSDAVDEALENLEKEAQKAQEAEDPQKAQEVKQKAQNWGQRVEEGVEDVENASEEVQEQKRRVQRIIDTVDDIFS